MPADDIKALAARLRGRKTEAGLVLPDHTADALNEAADLLDHLAQVEADIHRARASLSSDGHYQPLGPEDFDAILASILAVPRA